MTLDNLQVLQYKTNMKKRFFASLFDYVIVISLTYLYIDYFGTTNENGDGGKTVRGLMTLPLISFWFIYFVVVEACFGGTLLHLAFNLKVLTLDRRRIEFMQALKRHLVDPIDFFIWGLPAAIAIKNSDKHQRLGDMWAKTIVVDISDPTQMTTQNTE
jgi:uncharacterized RDD family membrane protein YckC